MLKSIKKQIAEYLSIVDSSIDLLSNRSEGALSKLPSWLQSTRKINIGYTSDFEGFVIKIEPNVKVKKDEFHFHKISSASDASKILAPMNYKGTSPNRLQPEDSFLLISELSIVEVDNPIAPPVLDSRNMFGWGRKRGLLNSFLPTKAKEQAIDLWNKSLLPEAGEGNYIHNVTSILRRFSSIVRRKSFIERRIHRYINTHRDVLLPVHKKCYYEHRLFFEEDYRDADFILEREQNLPAILIELESPVHKVFTKSGDLTAAVNHARNQISEWIKFINNNLARNASGDLDFLRGPHQRLVIIGRGLEHSELLKDTKYNDTIIWTYDLMISEAKAMLNKALSNQYRLLNMKEIHPF